MQLMMSYEPHVKRKALYRSGEAHGCNRTSTGDLYSTQTVLFQSATLFREHKPFLKQNLAQLPGR